MPRMPDATWAGQQVERRLAEGWRPSQTRERTWVRGAERRKVGEDRVEDLTGAETAPMTAGEEGALLERNYTDGAAGNPLDDLEVVDDQSGQADG